MKQLGLAVHAYHDAHHQLPSLFNSNLDARSGSSFGLETHSWRTMILPHIEQPQLEAKIDLAVKATHRINQAAINEVVSTFACPSTPRSTTTARGLWFGRAQFDDALTAATADYVASIGYIEAGVASRQSLCNPAVTQYFNEQHFTPGAWGEVESAESIWDEPTVRTTSWADVTDGLSRTMLIFERAGLPDQYFDAGTSFEPHQPPEFRTWGNVGIWAISAEEMMNYLYHQTGVPIINSDNMLGIYAFHARGAQLALADGSVHFLGDTVASEVVLSLATRSGEEIIDLAAVAPH